MIFSDAVGAHHSGRSADAAGERVLDPLPPLRGRGFASSWWGRSWTKALEDSALENDQLKAGRRLARAGLVGAVMVRPGRITAVVRERNGSGQRADVLLRQLTDADWDRLLDAVAAEAGHLAALLDGELSPGLVTDAAACGVDLLPGIGDLEPSCECGAWDLCAHTAALSYQLARQLDEDPFLLLMMRGRPEAVLLSEVRRRGSRQDRQVGTAPGGTDGDHPSATVPAGAAWSRRVPELPPLPPPVAAPGGGPALAADTAGTDIEVDGAALEFLVVDSAVRAARQLAGALASGHADTAPPQALTPWEDAARMAGDHAPLPPVIAARLAEGCGTDRESLAMAGLAWHAGGPAGLRVLTEDPDTGEAAAAELRAAWEREDPGLVPRLRRSRPGSGRWTVVGEDLQLRRDAAGVWWPYYRSAGRWRPAGPAEDDPAATLAAARDAARAAD